MESWTETEVEFEQNFNEIKVNRKPVFEQELNFDNKPTT